MIGVKMGSFLIRCYRSPTPSHIESVLPTLRTLHPTKTTTDGADMDFGLGNLGLFLHSSYRHSFKKLIKKIQLPS